MCHPSALSHQLRLYLLIAIGLLGHALFVGGSVAIGEDDQPSILEYPGIAAQLGTEQLHGRIRIAHLQPKPYGDWFQPGYDQYTPDPQLAAEIQSYMVEGRVEDPIKIKIFLGTWCRDSREQVPRFLRLMREVGVPETAIHIQALGNLEPGKFKRSENKSVSNHLIHRTPTFVFFAGENELGRIVETPLPGKRLEEDVAAILRGDAYTPRYAGEAMVHQYLEKDDWQELLKPSVISEIAELLREEEEDLPHYIDWDLLYNGESEKALLAIKLQEAISGTSADLEVYRARAHRQIAQAHIQKSQEAFFRAGLLDPSSEEALDGMAGIRALEHRRFYVHDDDLRRKVSRSVVRLFAVSSAPLKPHKLYDQHDFRGYGILFKVGDEVCLLTSANILRQNSGRNIDDIRDLDLPVFEVHNLEFDEPVTIEQVLAWDNDNDIAIARLDQSLPNDTPTLLLPEKQDKPYHFLSGALAIIYSPHTGLTFVQTPRFSEGYFPGFGRFMSGFQGQGSLIRGAPIIDLSGQLVGISRFDPNEPNPASASLVSPHSAIRKLADEAKKALAREERLNWQLGWEYWWRSQANRYGKLEERLASGITALLRDKPARALLFLEDAVAAYPEAAKAHFFLAHAYLQAYQKREWVFTNSWKKVNPQSSWRSDSPLRRAREHQLHARELTAMNEIPTVGIDWLEAEILLESMVTELLRDNESGTAPTAVKDEHILVLANQISELLRGITRAVALQPPHDYHEEVHSLMGSYFYWTGNRYQAERKLDSLKDRLGAEPNNERLQKLTLRLESLIKNGVRQDLG